MQLGTGTEAEKEMTTVLGGWKRGQIVRMGPPGGVAEGPEPGGVGACRLVGIPPGKQEGAVELVLLRPRLGLHGKPSGLCFVSVCFCLHLLAGGKCWPLVAGNICRRSGFLIKSSS